jgi:hypothetical protein
MFRDVYGIRGKSVSRYCLTMKLSYHLLRLGYTFSSSTCKRNENVKNNFMLNFDEIVKGEKNMSNRFTQLALFSVHIVKS